MSNDSDLVGVRHAARAREFARVRLDKLGQIDRVGPEHPDFAPAEPANHTSDAPNAEPADAAIDFAAHGPVVDRMRAAFFGRS